MFYPIQPVQACFVCVCLCVHVWVSNAVFSLPTLFYGTFCAVLILFMIYLREIVVLEASRRCLAVLGYRAGEGVCVCADSVFSRFSGLHLLKSCRVCCTRLCNMWGKFS